MHALIMLLLLIAVTTIDEYLSGSVMRCIYALASSSINKSNYEPSTFFDT
jgi:hypothetical protein